MATATSTTWHSASAVVTDASGNYSFKVTVGTGAAYTVTPSSGLYTFSPTSRVYSAILSNQSAQNYAATALATTTTTSTSSTTSTTGTSSTTATPTTVTAATTTTTTQAQGGTALSDYIASKGYLDFAANNRTLGNGIGFWLNRP